MTWTRSQLDAVLTDRHRRARFERLMLARAGKGRLEALDHYWLFPHTAMTTPDPWQRELLFWMVTRRDNIVTCCASQIGKTESVSAGAYIAASLGLYVLVVAPSDRQSMKFHNRVLEHHGRLNLVPEREEPTKHELTLMSGGKVEAVPNSPDKIRGIAAVDLLIIDEASRASDELYGACTRMLGVSKGRIVLLSTPNGRRGFFWEEWIGKRRKRWQRKRVSWRECPRITEEFLAGERTRGRLWMAQEWLDCPPGEEFIASDVSYFDTESFKRHVDDDEVVVNEFANMWGD